MKRIYIYAMSGSRKDVAAELDDAGEQIFRNLLKIYIFRNAQCVHHWMAEAAAQTSTVRKLKSTHDYPNADFIYANLVSDYPSKIHKYIRIEMAKEANLQPNVTVDEAQIVSFTQAYIKKISKILSKDGALTAEEVIPIITKLLTKY